MSWCCFKEASNATIFSLGVTSILLKTGTILFTSVHTRAIEVVYLALLGVVWRQSPRKVTASRPSETIVQYLYPRLCLRFPEDPLYLLSGTPFAIDEKMVFNVVSCSAMDI